MSARILIVDDTPLNVKLLAAKLAHDYYVVSTAQNGVEALAKVAAEKPDIILLDVMMPEMDGFETCRRLKADSATAFIPVVMITALSDVADRVRGLAAGADDFLGKPINDLALMARIRSLLRTKMLMDEWRLREQTVAELSPDLSSADHDPLNVRDSRVLIVDDAQHDTDFIRKAMTSLSAQMVTATSVNQAVQAFTDQSFDLIFANLDLRHEDGLMICPHLRTNPATRNVPILMIANPDDIARVARGLDLGANDYLLRPLDAHELFARSRTQLRHKRNFDRLRQNYEQNMKMALVDPLTGAFNRRYLDAHLPRYLRHAADVRKTLSIQMVDIDHFKSINDRYGHAVGDAVLKELVLRIGNAIRPSDFMVRMGGEEFAIVMQETGLSNCRNIAERLRQTIIGTPFKIDGIPEGVPVTISIGVADTRPDVEGTPNRVFERADAALYQAKNAGRNCIVADTSVTGHES